METTRIPDGFLAGYYAGLSPEDQSQYEPGKLEARAAAHYRAARGRTSETDAWVGVLPDEDNTVLAVIAKDMPFLVDSLLAELTRRKLGIRLVVHPRFLVARNAGGAIESLRPARAEKDASAESWITVELRDLLEPDVLKELLAALRAVLKDVHAVTIDWQRMRQKLRKAAGALVAPGLQTPGASYPATGIDVAKNFLRWLESNHFVFVGYREYRLERGTGEDRLIAVAGSGLGVLRLGEADARPRILRGAARDSAREPAPIVITKAASRSTVHRDAHLDYIGVKTFDSAGHVIGEHRFLGLFTSSVYNGPIEDIPVVGDKIRTVLSGSGFAPESHSGRQLMSILETYPRDELFQIGVDDLLHKCGQIIRMQERRMARALLRADAYGRFVTVLVYLPRDRYNTSVRTRIEDELRVSFGAYDVEHEARVSSSALARIFFTVWTSAERTAALDEAGIERRVSTAVRSWPEGIVQGLQDSRPAGTAEGLAKRWEEAFPAEYRVRYSIEDAIRDIGLFDELDGGKTAEGQSAAKLFIDDRTDVASTVQTRLYVRTPQSLSRILPYFEHLGLEVVQERPYEITDSMGDEYFLYDLIAVRPFQVAEDAAWDLLPDAFNAVLKSEAESDVLNSLVLQLGLPWRLVALLRCYVKYLRQLGTAHSFDFVASTLQAHPQATSSLVRLFQAKFEPDQKPDEAPTQPAVGQTGRFAAVESADSDLSAALNNVATLDAAFVLETLANLVRATVRTNFYQGKPYISLKLDPSDIAVLPKPRPKHEVWVYSPRMEGVHLRFGRTARGGLRWSDRQEDFRTEVLGLVKAQVVKNSVIVPDGAKGGFYAKHAPGISDRSARLQEGKDCYRTFIRGLLDVTDNIRFDENGHRTVVPPADVVRYDGDDAYLVVAADKGTATFSDIANGIAADYGFWLGDAFASGGSEGYDHKRMGITARGAWESVKIHFSELGLDPQSVDFTAAGVGDMSGDVFGNGMLLSRHIRLVAAFDHRHIFLDPQPDTGDSFAERERLFSLPRSSWEDYDRNRISDGGGVWSRTVRTIPLHPAVREALGLDQGIESLSPPALLRAILKAPVDLLYNGGIGTYIKASSESHADTGDRANDAIRINGNELRARVVVEGGNLGATQAGRIEAALNGILLNTDAIDNSAGVDCSDHEVNIKILVDQEIRAGRLPGSDRAWFLAGLTDHVAEAVLANNVAQNILLLTDRRFPPASFPNYERFMQFLESRGELDRKLEFLPSTQELEERISKGKGLTSPELSVLAAYSKNSLAAAIRQTSLVQDPYLEALLRRYFPRPLVEHLGAGIDAHPLKDDIIAMMLANDAVNIGGITAIFRLMEETSSTEVEAVKAFVIASELFGLRELSAGLVRTCADLPAEKWSRIYLDIRRVLDRAMRWFLQHDHRLPVAECIGLYRPVIDELRPHLPELLVGRDRLDVSHLLEMAGEWGLPEVAARAWAELREAFTALDIARVQQLTAKSLDVIAPTYFEVHERFGIEDLLGRIDELPRSTKWQAMARASLREDLSAVVPELAVAVLAVDAASSSERLGLWEARHHSRLVEADRLLKAAPEGSFEALAAYTGTLRRAAQA